ncbi:uncharacterized protein LOC115686163 [Syzygium oleosum]|uniref:uncharacterized protein LOC115686163 n=1 Tax=Syzygium oleosum TaxID=219896 RepID=UPI0011D1BA08|nr:uncharacterized protein LOC115686163 [Syzygium oleosum]
MARKHLWNGLYWGKHLDAQRNGFLRWNVMFYHSFGEARGVTLPAGWYEKAFRKMTKLSDCLKDVDLVDGRLVNLKDGSIVVDDLMEQKVHTFKSLARAFIGSPSIQQTLRRSVPASSVDAKSAAHVCFSKVSEREPMIINSLTKISNILNISAQQRKSVRVTVCPQVTQHQIWTATLEEILNGLKYELDILNGQCPRHATKMGRQIVSVCLKFLEETSSSFNPDSSSWMRVSPAAKADYSASRKWEDAFEMFDDLIRCLKCEEELLLHLKKLEAMKEGLSQIRDVVVDRCIGYKDVRHQESLVQKKLTKTLGYSSPCLFTLLLYYLYGYVRDLEVDLSGGFWGHSEGGQCCLHLGRILTSDEENIVWNGLKHLHKALGLFKFVWETAGMEGVLEVQGHLWCVQAEDRTLTYKGNLYFVHGITL